MKEEIKVPDAFPLNVKKRKNVTVETTMTVDAKRLKRAEKEIDLLKKANEGLKHSLADLKESHENLKKDHAELNLKYEDELHHGLDMIKESEKNVRKAYQNDVDDMKLKLNNWEQFSKKHLENIINLPNETIHPSNWDLSWCSKYKKWVFNP